MDDYRQISNDLSPFSKPFSSINCGRLNSWASDCNFISFADKCLGCSKIKAATGFTTGRKFSAVEYDRSS